MPQTDPDLAARHQRLRAGYGGAPDPADPAEVLAMPLVLHLPKAEPPQRTAVLEAAAAATIALCLDSRCSAAGPWHDAVEAWLRGRIRKVARRARGPQWVAAQDVAGVTVEVDGAQARAIVPGPVGQLDRRIKRLQIGGTDLEHDRPQRPPDPECPLLWINGALDMTLGKAAAQVGHATMLLAGVLDTGAVAEWARRGYAVTVREADPQAWAGALEQARAGRAVAVRDAGFTEVAPGSTTVVAVPPRC